MVLNKLLTLNMRSSFITLCTLLQLEFSISPYHLILFIIASSHGWIHLLLYVVDIIIICDDIECSPHIKAKLHELFI